MGKSFLLMLTFLTRIPIAIRFNFQQKDFIRGWIFFPIIGFIVGLWISWPILLLQWIPALFAPLFILLLYLTVVGGIHIDGVSDVFDGIFSAREREKMLTIMEDSRIGAFGAIGLILYFLSFYVGLLYWIQLVEEKMVILWMGWLVLTLIPIIGRVMALVIAGFGSYAKNEGMGKSLIDAVNPVVSILLIVLLCIISVLISMAMFLAVLITIILTLFIFVRIHKILKGITGDVIGLVVEVSQVFFIIAMCMTVSIPV